MRSLPRVAALTLLALGATAPVAHAQEKATEITVGVLGLGYTSCDGCDGVFELATGGANSGVFTGIGGGSLAVGFYLSPGLALEPTVAVSTISSDGETLSVFSLGIAVPYYFNKGWGRKGPYLSPRFTYNSISAEGESASQAALGLGVGTKVPLNENAALRLQANFDYGFENQGDFIPSTTSFGAFFGLSVFLK